MSWFEQLFNNQSVQIIATTDLDIQRRLLNSVIIILCLWLLRLVLLWFVDNRIADIRTRYLVRKISIYLMAVFGLILFGSVWSFQIESLVTFLGLVSAGLAIALQGPLTDLAGWLFILSRRPFQIGDRIQIGDHAGDVVDIRILQFTVLEIGNWVHADQSTGRILHVPNRKVFSEVMANYSKGFEYIWHEIEVLITFESNWQQAKGILDDIANRDAAHLSQDAAERVRRAARRFYIHYAKLTPIVYMRVVSNGVQFTLRYLCAPRQRRSTEQAIWEDILNAFAKHPDIEFAYPTQRFYQRQVEREIQPTIASFPEDGNTI